MKKIQIGVSAYFIYPDPKRTVFGYKMGACLENDLARYLARPGMTPVLIPDLDPKRLEELLEGMGGFVLQGGADVAPQTYGQPCLDAEKWPGDAHRDRYELQIIEFAVKRRKPILGICRGCQLINVYFGGTLYQDLRTELGGKALHRDADLYDKVHHRIAFEANGLLSRLYAEELRKNPEPRVNSVHHQGLRKLGKDLKVEATCPDDGLIEAVAAKDLEDRFVLGVQWHPEFSHTIRDRVISPEPLYDHFLDEVAGRKKA